MNPISFVWPQLGKYMETKGLDLADSSCTRWLLLDSRVARQ